MEEPKASKQPFKEMNSEDFKALFRSYWNFKGELTRKEFYPRILMLVILAVPSVLVVSIPLIGPVYVLALTAGLSAVIVQRLRHMAMPWWLVFLLVVPGLGWIVLGFLMALKGAKNPDEDGLSPAHRQVLGVALVTTAVFLALALLINQGSTSDSGGSSSSDDSQESAQVVESEAPSSSAEPQDQNVGDSESAEIADNAEIEEEAAERALEDTSADAGEDQPASDDPTQGFDELFAGLTIEAEVSGGYDRDLFRHWIDADGNGCDARREVLILESTTPVSVGGGCSLSGGTWVSAFDGVSTTDSSSFDVDHFVPLKEAWDSGANEWDSATRQNFANDLGYEMSLIAVSASSNRSKGASDPSGWMPPTASYKCEYVYSWIQVKLRWQLSVDPAEASALKSNWAGCSVNELDFAGQASGATIGTAPAPETNNQDSAEPAPAAPEPEVSGCVNINTATVEELQQIIHMGPTRANELITLRPFSSLNDMDRIGGIKVGGARLNEIKAEGLACVG